MPNPIHPAQNQLNSLFENSEAQQHVEEQHHASETGSDVGTVVESEFGSEIGRMDPRVLQSALSDAREATNTNHLDLMNGQGDNLLHNYPALHAWLGEVPDHREDLTQARQHFIDGFIENGGYEESGQLFYPNSLSISRNFLDELPPNLKIKGDLSLNDLFELSSLPSDLEITGSLHMTNCRHMTRFFGSPQIQGNVHIDNCPYLQYISLKDDAHIAGHLIAKDSPNIDTIECNGLQGPLIALRLYGLQQVDPTLFSHSLDTDFDSSQEEAEVNPRVYILDSTLTYADIYNEIADDQRAIDNNALCMSYNPPGIHSTARFAKIEDALDFWNVFANKGCDRKSLQYIPDDQKKILSTFLLHLTKTSDFKRIDSLDQFADRISNFIRFFESHPNLQEELSQSIDHANQGCGDRTIQSLSQLELTMQVEAAREGKKPRAALRNLALGLIKLDVVHKAAFNRIGEFSASESSELVLRFETELAEKLNLPLFNRSMLYSGLITVPKAVFTKVEQDAEAAAADEVVVNTFLDSWEPWQILQRQESGKKVQWHELESVQIHKLADECCLITMNNLEKVKQPVKIHNEAGYFDLKPLLKWWSEKGTHPISQEKFTLNDLRKVGDDIQANFRGRLRNKRAPSTPLSQPVEKAVKEPQPQLKATIPKAS